MASVKQNIVANYIGQIWAAFLGFAVVPIYIKLLGVEAYGLIGFFMSLQAMISVLDLGLSTTANREVARCSDNPDLLPELYRSIRTLQTVYVVVAIGIACGISLLSGIISTRWINSSAIDSGVVSFSILIFAFTLALRWPVALYTGVLRGMQHQVKVNKLGVAVASFKSIGSLVVVAFVWRSVLALLGWFLLSALLEVMLFYSQALKCLPSYADAGKLIYPATLKRLWNFSFSVGLISIFAVIIKQMDKVLISRLLPLEQLGYYMIAAQAVTGVGLIIGPVLVAIFPLFTSLFHKNAIEELAAAYHKYSQIVAFLGVPMAVFFIYFSYEVVFLWTQSASAASESNKVLSFLAIAAMFNSVMQVSYLLQLASGLHRIALFNNLFSLFVMIPLTYLFVLRYGIIGGAASWAVFNVAYYLIVPQITHRYILPGHLFRWVFFDTIPFMGISLLSFGIPYLVSLHVGPAYARFGLGLSGFILYLAISYLMHKGIRNIYGDFFCGFRSKLSQVQAIGS